MFPVDSLRHVISYLRGEPGHDLRCVAEAAYDLLGYVASQVIPGTPHVFTAGESLTDAEKANALESFTLARGDSNLNLPPWLVDTLLSILRKWLVG